MLLRDTLEYELNEQEAAAKKEAELFIPISSLLSNSVYMLLVLTITSLYFVISGLQFWVTAYLTIVMEVP